MQLHQLARVVLVHADAAAFHRVREQRVAERRVGATPLLQFPLDRIRVEAVDDALIVVEVDEHHGARRDSAKQVAELAQCVLANRAIVLDERERARGLVRAHREMVFPEVRHHLEQLPVARDGANENRGLKLADRRRARRQKLRQLLHQHRRLGHLRLERDGVERRIDRIARGLPANLRRVGLLADGIAVLVGLRVIRVELERRLVRDLEEPEHAVGDWIGDSLGMQLPLDPARHADAFDFRDILVARAESQSIERLASSALSVERPVGGCRDGDGGLGLRARAGCRREQAREGEQMSTIAHLPESPRISTARHTSGRAGSSKVNSDPTSTVLVHDDVAVHRPREVAADRQAQPGALARVDERSSDLNERLEDRLELLARGCRGRCREPGSRRVPIRTLRTTR